MNPWFLHGNASCWTIMSHTYLTLSPQHLTLLRDTWTWPPPPSASMAPFSLGFTLDYIMNFFLGSLFSLLKCHYSRVSICLFSLIPWTLQNAHNLCYHLYTIHSQTLVSSLAPSLLGQDIQLKSWIYIQPLTEHFHSVVPKRISNSKSSTIAAPKYVPLLVIPEPIPPHSTQGSERKSRLLLSLFLNAEPSLTVLPLQSVSDQSSSFFNRDYTTLALTISRHTELCLPNCGLPVSRPATNQAVPCTQMVFLSKSKTWAYFLLILHLQQDENQSSPCGTHLSVA